MARLDYPAGATGEEGVEDAGFFTRLMWVYFSPRKAFTAVARRPNWVFPFILLIVLSGIVSYISGPINQEYMAQRIEQSDKIPEDRKEEILENMTGGSGPAQQAMRIGGGAIVVGIMMLIMGGFFLVINNLILGGSARFAQALGAAVHVCLVWIPSWILKVPLMLAQRTIHINFGPAALLGPEAEGSLMWASMMRIDVFGIWQIILACIALSCLGGYTAKKAASAVVPLWIVYSVIVVLATWFGFQQIG
jgi:hypothetical protein